MGIFDTIFGRNVDTEIEAKKELENFSRKKSGIGKRA